MTREGDTLTVDMGERGGFFGWSDRDDCTLSLTAQLAPEAMVSIRQNAARIRLSGDFSAIDVDSDAGDFAFSGHAATVTASGAALRARLAFERVMNTEEIRISGKMIDTSVRFLTPTPVSYGVEAVASYVDSALANTPGARPDIRIRGEMVRVRIE